MSNIIRPIVQLIVPKFLQCGLRAQFLCPKLGPRPTEAIGPGLIPLCSIQSPLGMQFYSVYLTIHYQRLAQSTHLGRERYCLRMLHLGCQTSLLGWEPIPKPLLPLLTKHPLKNNGIGPPSPLIT